VADHETIGSRDGTPIAVFAYGGTGPPIVLVHGASADHTTWRASGPQLVPWARVVAIDRRGRGASGDHGPYGVAREFEDLAAVAEWMAGQAGAAVTLVGHSFGGRVALGAALLTDAVGRLVVYESAPAPPGGGYQPAGIVDRLRSLAGAGERDALLATFLAEIVGMSVTDIAAYRADPVWPRRAAAAPTIVRELEAEVAPEASLDALGGVRQPVLQVLGGDSRQVFADATRALDERLARGAVRVIPGARHAAHHSHVPQFVDAVRGLVLG
jgi:pimeloyl-ACP methyl ester carboxylesterase